MIQNILLVPTSIRDDDLKGHLPALLKANKTFQLLYALEQSFCSEVLSTLTERCVYIDFKWMIDQHHEYHQFLNTLQFQIPSLTHCDDVYLKRQILKLLEEEGLEVTTDLHLLKQYSTQHHLYMQLYQLIKKQYFYKQWVMKLQPYRTEDLKRLRLHGSWRSSTSYTGRITASKVNLTALPNAMKPYIVPSSQDSTIWSIDFVNAELRFLALYSGDKQLQKDIAEKVDIHEKIGNIIHQQFGTHSVKPQSVRSIAKTFIFAMLYGAGSKTLGSILKSGGYPIDNKTVKVVQSAIFIHYESLEQYFRQVENDVYIRTFFGYVSPLVALSKTQKRNFALQSSIATAIKLLSLIVSDLGLEIINIIHDEIWIEVSNELQSDWFSDLEQKFKDTINKFHPDFCCESFLKIKQIGGSTNDKIQ
ncbi:DNA polymerase [Macrococcoides bohemicum]|uniref:DNA polymerase n=1 Tax=Macrococcoides bohemicum TaxID=1903056 RepID=UPI0028B0D5C3|nr:DNA polymerase [Macrococcus bohemicus]